MVALGVVLTIGLGLYAHMRWALRRAQEQDAALRRAIAARGRPLAPAEVVAAAGRRERRLLERVSGSRTLVRTERLERRRHARTRAIAARRPHVLRRRSG